MVSMPNHLRQSMASTPLIRLRQSMVPTWMHHNLQLLRLLRKHTQPAGLLSNWMLQLKMYKRYAYQCSHQYLHHILKEQELNQDVKKILREYKQLKAIPAR